MTEEISKTYDAKTTDKKWLEFWEEQQLFVADPESNKPPYCIVIPPPNVTGALHMGHALVMTLQDILIRWKRMSGYEVLWVPGTDHAGISTQTVVERYLIKNEGKRRTDYSREDFLSYVWEWKEGYEKRITNQLKSLGCSCDWTRQRFTMDPENNQSVKTAFKKLFDNGLIYRGDYLVNWDPVTQTAIADDEVEYEERQSFLWTIEYPLKDGSGSVSIATTRPETMLGDTAVAVNPKDERYRNLIGKTLILPLVNREISIIEDHRVDPEFGTGAVKITPAHDPNDYQMGLDHNLPFINIMNPDGSINENGGEFAQLSMKDGREKVVEQLKEKGFLKSVDPHTYRVGLSYRSKAVIEPYMSKQWFVKMSEFAHKLEEAINEKKVKLIPKNWENVYFHWIRNLRDWCISRQLWWGHRIPIWYNKDNPEEMICFDGEGLPPEVAKNPDQWEQDEDVLDTWFSSSLWPFATLGWPKKTKELDQFFPNSVLVTGHDILFFWVARMIFMGEYMMGEVPFPEVFLHGLIYGKSYWRKNPDGGITYLTPEERREYEMGKPIPKGVEYKWEKMSKSKGNIIDPLEIIDEYGTDAMRMALTASATQTREIDLDRRRFDEFKNFANKVWNGARFVFMNLNLTSKEFQEGLDESHLRLEDHWILSKFNHIIQQVNHHLSTYQFDQSALEAYDFFWKEFCAYYVEISKPVLFGKSGTPEESQNKQKILAIVLCGAIRLLHPMAPFITEELFATLKEKLPNLQLKDVDPYTHEAIQALSSQACMCAPFPQVIRKSDINPEIEEAFDAVEQVVYTIRNIRGEMKLTPAVEVDVYIVGPDTHLLQQNESMIRALVRVKSLHYEKTEPELPFASTGMMGEIKVMIPMPQELLAQEKMRLQKEEEKLSKQMEKLRIQLENPQFIERAPEHLVQKQRDQLGQFESEIKEIQKKMQRFSAL
ncbi:MAG: Valine--tRNA ligase [Chlamydiae bacterium]|nr:Valine--tRNA ligase [Chlamydiota bacterium]